MSMNKISSLPTMLIDGRAMVQLGYGTGTRWSKRGDPNISRPLVNTLKKAISLGFTHLDCADDYNTEAEVGLAVKECGLARDELFVTTKVHHGIYDIPKAFHASLEKMKLHYADLYLIHAPFMFNNAEEISTAWAAMEELHAQGLAKSIGVSNFRAQDLATVLKTCKVVPAVNQIEFHPYRQRPEVMAVMNEHGILPVGYGALVSLRKKPGGPVDEYVEELAAKYSVGPPEILMRWQVEKGMGVITTTSSEEHMKQYKKVGDFEMTTEEVKEIDRLGSKLYYIAYWSEFKSPGAE